MGFFTKRAALGQFTSVMLQAGAIVMLKSHFDEVKTNDGEKHKETAMPTSTPPVIK